MKFWQVDSFSSEPFRGNPAAVLVLKEELSDQLMQKIASEMNLSETAFVLIKDNQLNIRWCTPSAEVDLCGHATLAAAHVLWSEGFVTAPSIDLNSRSGVLGVARKGSSEYVLDFPVQEALPAPASSELVTSILGVAPSFIGSNGADCVAVVESDQLLKEFVPNLELIAQLPERGFLVTAKDSSGNFDYLYRGFFPKLQIPEDPVTGSANTALAPYWSKRLGKSELTAYQASERGGELGLALSGDRVLISGQAVTVIDGNLRLGF